IELEYRVPNAQWVPSYRLDRHPGSGGTLTLRALVAQRTEEDWSAVRLAVSTADLHRPAELPKLRSLRIGRRQPVPPVSGWREPPSGLPGLFTDYDRVQRPEPPIPVAAPAPVAAPTAAPVRARGPYPGGGAPAAPLASGGPPPAPAFAAAPQALSLDVQSTRGIRRSAAVSEAGFGGAEAAKKALPVPPEPVGPVPGSELLDYAALTLAGPEEGRAQRGRLRPVRRPEQPVHRSPQEPPAHAVSPRQSAGSFDQRFDAAGRVDLPADGVWHTVTLTELPVTLAAEYVCAPAVELAVFASLLLTNSSPHALLGGPLEVSADGAFQLSTALPTLAPGATRRIGLGVAESVRVSRRTESRESSTGLRSTTTVVTERIHVELANRLPHPITVEVRERIPVSEERELRIEELPSTPPWAAPTRPEPEDPAGARHWRLALPAGGTAVLDAGYELRFPAGRALAGGNRRSCPPPPAPPNPTLLTPPGPTASASSES
ncbi:hypothetical protein C7C46_13465, partial [Streptomyces tateyamensis]